MTKFYSEEQMLKASGSCERDSLFYILVDYTKLMCPEMAKDGEFFYSAAQYRFLKEMVALKTHSAFRKLIKIICNE